MKTGMRMRPGRVAAALLAAGLIAALPLAAAAADAPLMVNVKRLSLEAALSIANAAVADCRDKGAQIAVVVVDRGGHEQVVLRDVLAPDFALEAARQKAYTAMTFNAVTSTLAESFKEPHSVAKINGMLPAPGGAPVTAAGSLVAGVGVSGAPSGEMDEACAKAGVEAIAFELETAD